MSANDDARHEPQFAYLHFGLWSPTHDGGFDTSSRIGPRGSAWNCPEGDEPPHIEILILETVNPEAILPALQDFIEKAGIVERCREHAEKRALMQRQRREFAGIAALIEKCDPNVRGVLIPLLEQLAGAKLAADGSVEDNEIEF
jgi:hypothetical protein